jgi:cell shape-determining protein MreC
VLDARPGAARTDLTAYRRIPAVIVGVGGLPRADQLRINRGRRDGVQVGAAVLVANREGILVGVVQKVFPTSAVVSLLQSGGAGVQVTLAGQGSTRRTLSAAASGQLRITKLPAQAPPFRNQLVFTAGTGPTGLLPPGLQVGSVARVERTDGGLWTAWVAPSVDARRSLNVKVLGRR